MTYERLKIRQIPAGMPDRLNIMGKQSRTFVRECLSASFKQWHIEGSPNEPVENLQREDKNRGI